MIIQLQSTRRTRYAVTVLLLFVLGCTPVLLHQLDKLYGFADATRYEHPVSPISTVPEYWHDVRPLLEQRCTVCHGCYDAPCQQNLTSWDGIARGSNAEKVYTLRLNAVEPSRLFIDAQTPAEWRQKKFHPILNERENTRAANLQGSVLYRLLDLKRQHPLPQQTVLDSEIFTFSLKREQTCPTIEKMAVFEKEHPQWGMPYGLPGLSATEFTVMENWLAAGSPVAPSPVLAADIQQAVMQWEQFLNGDSLKQQLMSRYLYEHLFLAHIYFDEIAGDKTSQPVFFRLVRSSTPPATPITEIATRRPYDDPGMTQFWYRLRLDENSVVEKTHMPYALNTDRLKKWRQWFIQPNYRVEVLPSYVPEVASNPFIAFQALPMDGRYRFLLDEARFIIDTFIKGPVCRGQVALSVIEDHFWVFFVDPAKMATEETAEFLARESHNLRLPGEDQSDASVLAWLKYSTLQKNYLQAKARELEKNLGDNHGITLDMIWDGHNADGSRNDNASVTVFRHEDSASSVKGLVGQSPETAWLISYPLLERIYYLLVAGFDVYGSTGHQLNTRLYMDFLRMEGESNFLALLPLKSRKPIRDQWYRGASEDVKNYIFGDHFNYTLETGIAYRSEYPQQELYDLLTIHLGKNLAQQFNLQQISKSLLRSAMVRLQQVHGSGLESFPENSILGVDDTDGEQYYFTLIHNDSYSNISQLLEKDKRRRPEEDGLTVVPGIIGAYPNAFFIASMDTVNGFVDRVAGIKQQSDYTALADIFAVRRTNPQFWAFSDALQSDYLQQQPVTGGILDYNRFENR